MKFFIILAICFSSSIAIAQSQQSKNAYNDSMLTLLLKGVKKSRQEDFKKTYKAWDDDQKRLYEVMALPISSKKELIDNFDSRNNKINDAVLLFTQMVPAGFSIYIEFQPPDSRLKSGGQVDFWYSGERQIIFQEWGIDINAPKLDSLLQKTHWNRTQLNNLKTALQQANCISIGNKEQTEVGFARSGMGKYSYLVFKNKLTEEEIKKYNDKCANIYYKDNIVLRYGGGAVGGQCFPDED